MSHCEGHDGQGNKQSPINIHLKSCHQDTYYHGSKLLLDYDKNDCLGILNKGTTWSIRVRDDAKSTMKGPHLPGTYKLKEVHAHWGGDDCDGSEHAIDDQRFAAEIHLVHYNTDYEFTDALKQHEGLAVLGIFLKEDPKEGDPALNPLCEALKKIPYKDDSADFAHGLDMRDILPEKRNFCTYNGSLTTPPYSECVVWTVLTEPVKISKTQMQAFRDLHTHTKNEEARIKIVNNFRALQPLDGRVVKTSL